MHNPFFKIVDFPFLVAYEISLDFVMKVPDTEHTRFEGQTQTSTHNSKSPLTISFKLEAFLHYCWCNDSCNLFMRNVSGPQIG